MGRKSTLSVFQAHLPFKSRIPERQVAIPFHLERRAFTIIGSLLVVLAILYSYFVMLSVSHVVVREETLLENEALASEVANLEQSYLAQSVRITEDAALAHGFTRGNKQTFVARSAVALTNAQ